jgi:hypothetical protein
MSAPTTWQQLIEPLLGTPMFTASEVAQAADVDLELTRRLWRALGFPSASDDARIFTRSDVAILRAIEELHYDAFISDATWTALARRFDTHQLMDLVFTVGAYKMLAMALNSFGAQLDRGVVGFQTRN